MNVQKILNYYNLQLNENGKTLCPFHSESRASLSVDVEKEVFYCFGCGAKGDIVELVAKLEKVNRLKALQKIVSINGNKKSIKPLILSKPNKNWVKEAYEEYKKYDKPNWRMSNYLTKRGFSPKMLCEAKIRINPLSDYFYIIPLFENGKFKGYTKRTTDNRPSKYIFNRGFRRKRVLVGKYEKGVIFVTEGILDYLKARQFGINKNIVCLLGWKASKEQILKLKECTNTIITGLDNDTRGKEGVAYLKNFFKVIDFKYPMEVKDICEMKKKQFKKSLRRF